MFIIHGKVDGAFADEPHLRMRVMMSGGGGRAAGRQRSLVYLDSFSCGQLSPQHQADLGIVVGHMRRSLVERKPARRQRAILGEGLQLSGKGKKAGEQSADFSSGYGHPASP